jgi:branched-chain amino acid transport system substrate-binding protein
MSSITNKDQVIQMGVATSSPAYRSPDDYTFRNFPSADVDAAFLVKSILEKFNEKEIAIINVQNEYGVSSKKAVKDLFISKGGKVIFEDEIEPNGIDYRSIILKLKAANPKIVYFAVYPLEGAVFLKQAKSLGLSTTFIAGPAIIGSSKFMELSGNAAEGLIVVSTEPVFLKNKSTEIEEFNNSYLSKYGKRPSLEQIYAARAYDAFFLIANGIENCLNSSSECLKNYLYKVRTYPGVSGEISFDKNGDVLSKFELEVVKEGQFVEFK